MNDSKLKSNSLLASNLKSTTTSSLLTTTSSSLLTSSKLLTSSLSTSSNLSNFGLGLGLNLSTSENDPKKKINETNASLEIKKPKLLSSNENLLPKSSVLDTKTTHLTSNLNSISLSNKLTLGSSSLLSKTSVTSHSSFTSSVLSKPLTNTSLLTQNTKAKILESKVEVESNKRPYFHLESQVSIDDKSSFLQEEYLKSESLISLIDQEYKEAEKELNKFKKAKIAEYLEIKKESSLFNNQEANILVQKNGLINVVSSSLLREPNFKNQNDPTRAVIFKFADAIIQTDPEFLLKLALYTRKELNIRVTANFLLCLAAYKEQCRPYLQKYFKHSIGLPSDWIDVAEQYQLFMDKRINFGALPSALRKCMVEKFADFDKYQLAKYNKEKSRSAKNNPLKDVKHVKAKIKEADETEVVENKYIKTIKDGFKIGDRILIDLIVNEECKSLKFDIICREEKKEDKTAFQKIRRKNGKPEQPKKKEEANDSVACRVLFDFQNNRIIYKHLFKKEWSKRVETVNFPRTNELTKGHEVLNFFIDVKASNFTVGIIGKDQAAKGLGSYPHSKHNLQLCSLNCFRISGPFIKLKDLKIVSNEKVHYDTEMSVESDKEIKQRSFTLKQLVRQLHISNPVEHVMSLIGKKYPNTFEEFIQSKLPGMFDSEKAGKRMKLETPETWETQISIKGNKAEVWEQLIDHKKLPYMAMLRNLRNMIKTGISEKHHQWVIKKLQDEGAVINSKQFPFRFFTAYEVLAELEEEFNKYLNWSQTQPADVSNLKEKRKIKKHNHQICFMTWNY